MAKIQIELDLLNQICHSCDCIINGKKTTEVKQEDLKEDTTISIEDRIKPIPLDNYYSSDSHIQTPTE